jgi:hypothetical protein
MAGARTHITHHHQLSEEKLARHLFDKQTNREQQRVLTEYDYPD